MPSPTDPDRRSSGSGPASRRGLRKQFNLFCLQSVELLTFFFLILIELFGFFYECVECFSGAHRLALKPVKPFGKTLFVCLQLAGDLVETFEGRSVSH